MIQTINLNQFRDAFQAHERTNFSYEGLEVLFNHLEQWENDTGEEWVMDVIGLCCEFVEYDLKDLLNAYDITDEVLTDDNESEMLAIATDYLSENTWLCGLTEQNTFVFQQF
jgi:hypothetical protein